MQKLATTSAVMTRTPTLATQTTGLTATEQDVQVKYRQRETMGFVEWEWLTTLKLRVSTPSKYCQI